MWSRLDIFNGSLSNSGPSSVTTASGIYLSIKVSVKACPTVPPYAVDYAQSVCLCWLGLVGLQLLWPFMGLAGCLAHSPTVPESAVAFAWSDVFFLIQLQLSPPYLLQNLLLLLVTLLQAGTMNYSSVHASLGHPSLTLACSFSSGKFPALC